MNKLYSIGIILFIVLNINAVNKVASDPGESVSEAITANLGWQNSSMTFYNEVHNYNFTGHNYNSYNFTLFVPEKDDISISVYYSNGTLMDRNFTYGISKNLILGGEQNYIIKIYSSEFAVFPAQYGLFIQVHVGDEKESIASASLVGVGEYSETLNVYNEIDWYNFTASAEKTYNFEVHRPESAYISLYIYDNNMVILANDSTTGPINLLTLTGETKYVIGIYSSEFIIFPQDYTLKIIDVTPVSTTTTITDNTSTSTSATNQVTSSSTTSDETLTIENSSDSNLIEQLDFPWFVVIPAIFSTIYIKRKNR